MALTKEEAKQIAETQGDSRSGGVQIRKGNKVIDTISYEDLANIGGAVGGISGLESKPIYSRGDGGGYTANLNEAVGIAFDKEANKVTVKAPKSVLQSEAYKNIYNSDEFKNIAKAYIDSPDNKLTMTDGTETTAADLMKEYESSLQQLGEQRAQIDTVAKDLESYYGLKGLNDNQVIIAASKVDPKSDKKSAVYLPAQTIGGFDFSQYESFDKDNLTISKEDFDKFNQMRAFDDEHVKHSHEASDAAMKTLLAAARDSNYDYGDEGREEAVRWISFYNNLNANKASESAPAAVGNFINFGIAKCGEVIFDMANMSGQLAEKAGQSALFLSPVTGAELISLGQSLQMLAATGEMFGNLALDPKRFTGDQTWDGFSKLVSDFKDITGIQLSEEEQKKVQQLELDVNNNIAWRQTLSGGAVAGSFVGGMAGELIKQIFVVNPLGGAVSSAVTSGAGAVMAAGGTARTIEGLSKFSSLLGQYGTAQDLKAFGELALNLTHSSVVLSAGESTMASAVGKLADVASQGIIDTLTNDSEAMRKLYENNDSSSVGDELTSNFIWNAIGEVGAFGGSQIMSVVADTKFGRGMSLLAGRTVNELGALKNQAKLKLENIIGEWKVLKDSAGAGTRVFTERIIELQKEAASAKTLREFEDAIRKRVLLENAFDYINKGPAIELAIMKASPSLGDAISGLKTSTTELSAAIVKAGDKIMPGSKVSSEVANYLSNKMHLSRALADPKTAEGSWAKSLQESVTKLESSLAEKGLLDLANKNYDQLVMLNRRLTDYQIKNHIISKEDIKSLRETGYWGEDEVAYFHTQRIRSAVSTGKASDSDIKTALQEYRESIAKNSYREYHAKESQVYQLHKEASGADFVDPNVLIEGAMYQTAVDSQARKWGQALLNSSGVSKVLGTVGDTKVQVKASADLKKLRESMFNDVRKTAGNDYQVALDVMFPDLQAAKTKNATQLANLKKQKAEASKAYNRAVDTYTGMQLDANDLAEIEVGLNGRYAVPNFDPGQMSEDSFSGMVDSLDSNTKSLLQKQINSTVGEGANINLENYRTAYESIDGLDTLMRRSYITNNTKIKNTSAYKDTIRRVRAENDDFRNAAFLDKYQTRYDQLVAKYESLKSNPFSLKNGGVDFESDVKDMVQGIRENLSMKIKESANGRSVLNTLVESGVDEDTAIQYLVVDTLNRMATEGNNELRDSILKYMRDGSKGLYDDISGGDLKEFAEIVQDMSNEVIESEWNTMTRSLIDNGHQNLVDIDRVFEKVEAYAKDIIGKTKDSGANIIQTFGRDGKLQFVETDPLTKDLYEWRPNYSDSTPPLFFSLTNRIFKLTTSGILSVKSLFTQGVKDPLNTYVAGGAVPFLNRGMSRFFGGDAYAKISDTVVESLQDRVIRSLKSELGTEGWEVFERQAAEQGQSIGRAAVEYELITRPQAIAGVGGTETKFYQDISNARRTQNAYEYGGVISGEQKAAKFSDKLNEALKKAENISPANARETYLRNTVYQEQFTQAIAKGKSVDEARAIAERFMADATTNFSRPLAMGNRIARSIPYLSAAFNGKTSFMRLLEIDPAGVGGRLFGGVILPYMSLLAESLGKEENRSVYENLPESDKANGLTFVTNGVAISVPVPEELSSFISPFRQAVEKVAGANDHSWAELVANDLLQLPAMDLSGFYEIDGNELSNNPTFWERMGRGVEKLVFGQMSPAIVKSTYMAITGRDPYYGSEIDRSYVYDAGDGTVQTMDSNDNKIAMAVSSWAKSLGIDLSPSAAYSILGSTFGKGFLNLGDSLVSLLSGELTSVGDSSVRGVVNTFLPSVRDNGADAWRNEVNTLYSQKEKLINSDEYDKYVQAINNTQISEDKRQEYISNFKTHIQDYAKRVVSSANAMKEKYGLTAAQQATVISLLTFSDNTTPAFTASSRENRQDLFYDARSLAIETLNELGFTGSNDLSIFGYGRYVKNYETGQMEYKFQYNTPMAILDMGNVVWGQSEITLGNIKELIEGENGIKSDYNDFKAQRDRIYEQINGETDKKKKNALYEQLDTMDAAWSNRVMRAILPYIENYGLDNLLGNRDVVSYMDKYIKVPSNLTGDAKYMSQAKTGLDRNLGFTESYMKKWYELYQKEKQKGNK